MLPLLSINKWTKMIKNQDLKTTSKTEIKPKYI